MARNPLFLLPSVSGVPAEQRVQLESIAFQPRIVSPSTVVQVNLINPNIVEVYKRAIFLTDYVQTNALLNNLFLDGALLVRALVESAIEYVNSASLATVSTVLKNVRDGMSAETVISITTLLLRAPRSNYYELFVANADINSIPPISPDAPKEYRILNECAQRYRAYPKFVLHFPKDDSVVELPKPTSAARKKAAEMTALR